ncbi:MAG: hypothetical protein NT039_01970 [Candidatus Berkelbacteria bacterium]|nr:hypothetical protein [Candidatus Berkelbacteria bacterium]
MKKLALLVCLMLLSTTVMADSLLLRVCGDVDGELSQTAAWLGEPVDVFVFNLNQPKTLSISVGDNDLVKTSGKIKVAAGPSLVFYPHGDKIYVEPWVTARTKLLGGDAKVCLAYDQPLTRGAPYIFYSNDSSLMWKVTTDLKAGVVAHWFQVEGNPLLVHSGFKLEGRVDSVNLTLRYCPFGGGNDTIYLQGVVPLH